MHSHTGRIATTFVAVVVLAAQMHRACASWDHPHSDSGNTGFVRVVTAKAVRPMQIVPVGELSSGAGPVIGSDGTVFVGNLFGQMLAFRPNGTPLWGRQLPAGQWGDGISSHRRRRFGVCGVRDAPARPGDDKRLLLPIDADQV